jgi:uncharacterized protein (DUF305 family)
MSRKLTAAILATLMVSGAVALAQTHSGHGSHGAAPAAKPQDAAPAPSTAAYRAANEKMHKGMDIAFSGDADADFARGMIPHHQGAVDMAKIVLQFGKDPELRKLAQGIVAGQEAEITFMQAWLKKSGK